MDLKRAIAVAKQHIGDAYAGDVPQDVRLEEFLWDDHLGVWTLTMGFTAGGEASRKCKVVRVSEANKSVLSVRDA